MPFTVWLYLNNDLDLERLCLGFTISDLLLANYNPWSLIFLILSQLFIIFVMLASFNAYISEID